MFNTRSELEQLLAVAETSRIVAAAKRLEMTQPALTRAIAKLEPLATGVRLNSGRWRSNARAASSASSPRPTSTSRRSSPGARGVCG